MSDKFNNDNNPPEFQTGKVFVVSAAHMVNDLYSNYLPTLIPFLIISGLSISKSAYLVSVFTITSALLQPFFGYLVDKKNLRWMVYTGTLSMSVLLSLVGVINNYYVMFACVTLAGLGTAAFHPQAAMMISVASSNKRGLGQAIFSAAGNFGLAFSPLIVVPFIEMYGLKASPFIVIPGVIMAIFLFKFAPSTSHLTDLKPIPIMDILKDKFKPLSKIIGIVACRSLVYFGVVTFLPLYLKEQDVSLIISSHFVFVMLFCGAMGGLLGGSLSDKFGRKKIIMITLFLCTPAFYAFLITPAPYNYIFLGLGGALLLASFPVTTVLAQEILVNNAALATGLMLGFGIGIGGLGVGVIGVIAEHFGLNLTIHLLIFLPMIASFLAIRLKNT